MKHKLFTLLLAMIASVGTMFAETYSGSCGEDLTWSLNTEDSVLTIRGTGAMADYQNATQSPWNGYSSLIQSVIMNDNVTTVSNYAFAFCSNLKNVSLNQTLTTIGEHAFFSCPLLESVVIPDNVIVIGYNAFAQCSWLTSVHIGNKVTTIGKGAFARCGRLSSVVMFNSVTSIGDNAFDNCSALTTINIPNSITSIGKETFAFCAALTSIEIPESVTSIGENAFYGCSGLTSIAIPNSVTTIGNGAFAGCTGLTSLTIGNSVTSIGGFAFEGCRGLTSITNYAIEPQTINSNVFTNVDKSTCTLYVPAESISAYKSATGWKEFTSVKPILTASGSCGENVFWELNWEGTLCIYGTGAMTDYAMNSYEPWYKYSHSIKSVVVAEGVTSIGNYAFWHVHYNITAITIPNSVTSIGYKSFSSCSQLQSVTIPNSVTVYGVEAFAGCDKLTSIKVEADNPNYCSVDGVLFNKDATKIIQYPKGKSTSYNIPDGVKSIGQGAFYDCDNLTSITIPNSVEIIEGEAFYYCKSLTSVEIPDNVQFIGVSAFAHCTGLTTIEIPYNVKDIEGEAFLGCKGLTSVTLHNNVTYIGWGAFNSCSSLTSITIPSSVTHVMDMAFNLCSSLDSVVCEAIVPPAITESSFRNTNCTVYVPCNTLETYQASDYWKDLNLSYKTTKNPYSITVKTKTNGGSVTATTPTTICAEDTITATPEYGYHFDNWEIVLNSIPEDAITVSQAIQIASALSANETTANKYKVYGYITGNYRNYTNSYYLSDDANEPGSFVIYKAASSAEIGDYIMVEDYLYNYRGTTPETKSGGIITPFRK